jgi:hypothetical protein
MNIRRTLTLTAVALLLAACKQESAPSVATTAQRAPISPQVVQLATERGKAIVAQAFGVLSSNLLTALKQGGPTNALPFCSAEAQSITESLAAAGGVELRRVSHRARNPKNEADAVEFAIVQQFDKAIRNQQKTMPVVATSAKGQVAFYAPIAITNAVCLNCHGQPTVEVQPDTLALIRQRYPNDQATGFKLGDLRGLWVIEFRRDAFPTGK